jgi:putative methyltransferase (TIGR04325 family)
MVSRKTDALRRSGPSPSEADLPLLLALSLGWREREPPLRVLDFGGGCGAHHMSAAAFTSAPLRWAVVETPAMAQRGRERFASDTLSFHETVESALGGLGAVDLVFSSGGLQYAPDPAASLRELLDCGAPWLLLTRLALRDGASPLVSLQRSRLHDNGPGPAPSDLADRELAVPVTFRPRTEVEAAIGVDFTVRLHYSDGEGTYRAGTELVKTFLYLAHR